jgi:uncharacterized membrane protein
MRGVCALNIEAMSMFQQPSALPPGNESQQNVSSVTSQPAVISQQQHEHKRTDNTFLTEVEQSRVISAASDATQRRTVVQNHTVR